MFSLVLPFYNEEECVEEVIRALIACIRKEKILLKLVLVNNGSTDQTGAIIEKLKQNFAEVSVVSVTKNKGYGYGILQGLTSCKTPYLGFMVGDGQTESSDVVKVVRALQKDSSLDVCKIVRLERHDGIGRQIVSFTYNLLFSFIFFLPMKDVNGTPKFLKRQAYQKMKLSSTDWFIDAELILKAKLYNLKLKEIPSVYHQRETGQSHLRGATLVEFLKNLAVYRLRIPFTLTFNKKRWQ